MANSINTSTSTLSRSLSMGNLLNVLLPTSLFEAVEEMIGLLDEEEVATKEVANLLRGLLWQCREENKILLEVVEGVLSETPPSREVLETIKILLREEEEGL